MTEEKRNPPDGEVSPETTNIEDIASLEKALAAEKERAEGLLANWQRAQADFANYKRRTEQEREDFSKSANAGLILSLLPVLDDFERVLSAIPKEQAKLTWAEGIRLVERKFRAAMEAQGLTPIKAHGQPFDPNFHEAVKQDKGKEGIIMNLFKKKIELNG